MSNHDIFGCQENLLEPIVAVGRQQQGTHLKESECKYPSKKEIMAAKEPAALALGRFAVVLASVGMYKSL